MLHSIPLDTTIQQDGGPTHYRLAVRHILDETLPNSGIGRVRPTPWPARSPDVTSLDFSMSLCQI